MGQYAQWIDGSPIALGANVITLYRGRKMLRQCWRWRAVAPNGQILADSAEAYTNLGFVREIVAKLFPGYQVIDPETPQEVQPVTPGE